MEETFHKNQQISFSIQYLFSFRKVILNEPEVWILNSIRDKFINQQNELNTMFLCLNIIREKGKQSLIFNWFF
jgi:hypothetical protein